ncbi:MAG TPA: hypothetical protein VFZ31_04565 [Vicinamibacterales bacterium]
MREDGYLFPITMVTPELFERGPESFDPAEPFMDVSWILNDRGGTPVEIKTINQQLMRMPYCDDRPLWRTTLQRPAVRQGYAPIRKLGLAVAGASLEFPEEVSRLADVASQRVARRIVSLFLSKEKTRMAEEKGYVAAVAGSPVIVRKLFRHSAGDVSVYYFEATKGVAYSDGGTDPNAGLLTGWIADSATALRDSEVAYKINDDSYKQNDSAIVRGIVPYQGKALWVLEWHGWESEYFTVHDWPLGVMRLRRDAYACS